MKLAIPYGVADGQKGFDENLRLVREARRQIGPEVELMTDVYLKWDVDYTLRFARAARDAELKWIEEPIPVDDYEGMARLCREVKDTLIVSGEHEFTRYGFRELLRYKASQILQPDISWAGGFSECLKIAALGAKEGIPTWPHQGGTPWGLHLGPHAELHLMVRLFHRAFASRIPFTRRLARSLRWWSGAASEIRI